MTEEDWIKIIILDNNAIQIAADWFEEQGDPVCWLLRWMHNRRGEVTHWKDDREEGIIGPRCGSKGSRMGESSYWWYCLTLEDGTNYKPDNLLPYPLLDNPSPGYYNLKCFRSPNKAWRWAFKRWRKCWVDGKLTAFDGSRKEEQNDKD